MFHNRTRWILLAVFVFALFLRVYKLNSLPWGFYEEEVTNAYVGRFILQNGVDPYGNMFPLLYFDKFGDYPPVLPMYLSGLATFFFGANEFSARFPIALIGALTVFPVYGISVMIFRKKEWGIFSAFLLAILPWHVVLSRTTAEGIVGLAAYVWGIQHMLIGIEEGLRRRIISACALFFLTYFLYPSFRILVPLTLLPMVLFVPQKEFRTRRAVIGAAVCFFLFTAVISATVWGRGRFLQTSFFQSNVVAAKVSAWSDALSQGEGSGQIFLARAFHNKVVGYSRAFAEEYLSYFSPKFLFLEGAGQYRYYNVPSQGPLYILIAPLLLLAVLPFIKQRIDARVMRFIVYLLLIAPLPAALTIDFPPHAHRAIAMIFPLVLLATYGAYNLSELVQKKMVVIGIISVLLLGEGVYFWHQYDRHSAAQQSILRNDGDREMVQYLIVHAGEYERMIAPVFDRIPIYYLYFTNNFDRNLAGNIQKELYIDAVNNVTFFKDWCPSQYVGADTILKNTLIVDRTGCDVPPAFRVIFSTTRRDSTAAYTMLVPR